MKKNTKRNLLLTFAATAAVALSCVLPIISTAKAAATNGFVMKDGAQVRTDGAGIRFSTTLTQDYYNTVKGEETSVKAYTVIDKHGNTDVGEEVVIEHEVVFENGVATLNAAILYDELTAQEIDKASEIELEAKCYLQAGEQTPVEAACSDVVRSMRGVAVTAKMKENRNDLTRYIGTVAEQDLNEVKTAGLNAVAVGDVSGDVYLNAKKLDVTVNEGKVDLSAYESLLKDGETHYLSVFYDKNDGGSTNDASVFEFTYKGAKAIDMTATKFSAFEGTIDYSFLNGETIVSATQNGTALTVDQEKGTLKGVIPNITANGWYADSSTVYTGADVVSRNANANTRKVNPTTVRIKTEENTYDVTLMAYTLVINDGNELLAMSLWGAASNKYLNLLTVRKDEAATAANQGAYDGHYLDGYYILGNDIDASSWKNQHWAMNTANYLYGFTGVFDGDGHTITMNTTGSGLFGMMWRACIKDVNFVMTESGTSGFYGLAAQIGYANWKDATYIENVNITVNNFGVNGDNSAAIAKTLHQYTYLTNVTITLNWTDNAEKTTGLLFLEGKSLTPNTITKTTVIDNGSTNLAFGNGVDYTVSGGATAGYWASNDGKTQASGTVVIAGLTRQQPAN